MKDLFTMFPRKSKRHKQIYYVRFRDPETGERMTAVSSGQNTKIGAKKWAIEQLQKGLIDRRSKVNFNIFTKDWFIWDRCPYIALIRSKGQRFSKTYAENRRGFLTGYLQPFFGQMKLKAIKVDTIENFLRHLQKQHYSSSTINSAYYTLSTILSEADRLGIINTNPIKKVKCVRKQTAIKDTIPLETARQLFLPKNMATIWNNDHFHYLFNLIAYATGLRQSEILALRRMDIKKGDIKINHTWDRKYGLKEPKYESDRFVTLPAFAQDQISFYLQNPGHCRESFSRSP